jgi:CHASE3 domain sensor protein
MHARAKSERMIKAKIFAGYGLLIVLTVFISFITHRSFQNLTHSADRLAEPNKNIIMLHDIIFSLYQSESHIRTYTLTQEEEFLNLYFEELELIENLVDSLYVLSANDIFFSQRVDSISLLLHDKINLLQEFIELKSENANSVFYELALNKISKVQMADLNKSNAPDTLLVARAPSREIEPDDNISESEHVVSDQKDERRNLFRRVRDLFAGREKDDEIHEEDTPENLAGTYELEQVIISTTGVDGVNLKKDIEAILNNVKSLALQHQRRITELENEISA